MPPVAHERRLLAPAALTVLLVLSSGCVGGTGTPTSSDPTTTAGVAAPVLDEAGNALARFDLDGPLGTTVWANGTYTFQEHFFPLNLAPTLLGLAPPPGIRVLDISPHVPKGVPVRIVAEVQAEVADGDVDLWINAPFDEVWSGTWDTPAGGFSRIEMRIVHVSDEPVSVGLMYDEADQSTEFPYTLRVDVSAEPERILDAVGLSIDVPVDNATLLVTLEEAGEKPALLAWDANKRLLGRFDLKQGTTEVKLEDAGEHLLLLSQRSGEATIAVKGVSEPPSLKPAKQEIVNFQAEATGSPIKWSFEADREPIQVGYFVESGTVASDFSGTLTSPAGKLIENTFTGGPWVRPFMGFGMMDWTLMGGRGLLKGTYDIEIAFGQSVGPDPMPYGHFIVYIAPM